MLCHVLVYLTETRRISLPVIVRRRHRLVESDAPGCVKFTREYRVVDSLDRVDIVNVLDKKAVRRKEGVHLGFTFNVPEGVKRTGIPELPAELNSAER